MGGQGPARGPTLVEGAPTGQDASMSKGFEVRSGGGVGAVWWCSLAVVLGAAACDCGGGQAAPCTVSSDCEGAQVCFEGRCVEPGDGGTDARVEPDARVEADAAADARGDAMPPGPPCPDDGLCPGDARCVDGFCVPWGEGENNDACRRPRRPGAVVPSLQCVFEETPEGDPRPGVVRALHTPLVADLRIGVSPDAPSRPSIVYVADFGYRERIARGCEGRGVLRILDGATCRQQGVYADLDLNSPVTPAIGDLDGDGRPEIVAAVTEGGLVAFRVADDGTPSVLWRTTLPDGSRDLYGGDACQWGGISLFDVDDDGRPEVFFEGAFWDADGVRRGTLPGWTRNPSTGVPMPLGDYDGDGRVEAVAGNATWEYDPGSGAFAVEGGFSTTAAAGFTAVADFGDFPAAGGVPGEPEVVVVSSGVVTVRTLRGGIVGSVRTSTRGSGGPPTVADFDGDGVREIGVAFGGSYEVFEVTDAGLSRLWSQSSQDLSSSRTGSSVFDFNGDGQAEVVYGDECFVRVYQGTDGTVLFSQARFSSTWTEYPIVADVDADGSAEIVMGASGACNPDYCPGVDPIFAGLRCAGAEDCPSGRCEDGFCRCADDTECPRSYGCADAASGGERVCRALHRDCAAGIRVYRDARDGWTASRRIWNQHAYHVSNVEEDGTVPRSSAVRPNWSDPSLNNFRQNVQGELGDEAGPDLTIRSVLAVCAGMDGTRMEAEICNRGAVFLDTGLQVLFEQEAADGTRSRLCDLRTGEPLAPGACTTVSCEASVAADGVFVATADEEDVVAECREDNNVARSEASCLR